MSCCALPAKQEVLAEEKERLRDVEGRKQMGVTIWRRRNNLISFRSQRNPTFSDYTQIADYRFRQHRKDASIKNHSLYIRKSEV